MTQILKNNRCILLVTFLSLFFSCTTKSKYTIVSVESIYSENVVNNDSVSLKDKTKIIETVIAVFSKQKDSVTAYMFDLEGAMRSSEVRQFTSKRIHKNSILFLSKYYQDTTKVTFNINNEIAVNKDRYIVNKVYYTFLKQKILNEGQILPFVHLIKNGNGDYCSYYSPLLDYKWDSSKPQKQHKILEIIINNVNYQSSDDKLDNWKIIYKKGTAIGKHFNKVLILETINSKIIKIEYDTDRYHLSKIIYTDKNTLLDSISASWEAYSQSMNKYQIEFQKHQSKLDIIKTNQNPKNSNDVYSILKLSSSDN